ncbi:uncharacterized protein [Magallana gigas]
MMTGIAFLLMLFAVAQDHQIHVNGSRQSSVVYTRWGRKSCSRDAKLVHSGYVGGSHFNNRGAAVEPLCLPRNPQWLRYRDGIENERAYVHGAEYETRTSSGGLRGVHDQDVPCAVCLKRKRFVVNMFPARKNCYRGWTLEYRGYLMAGKWSHQAATSYTCVDARPEAVHGGHENRNGYLFYHVEGLCGSLKCPPYVNGRELACVVCSK